MTTASVLLDALREAGLEPEQVGERRWMVMLEGQWKRTLPVLLRLDERSLKLQAMLAPALDEGHADAYALLLHRNERTGELHFALDDEGDVLIVGQVPRAGLDADRVDELLGQTLTVADEVFNRLLELGFASYVEHEQRWRADTGAPPNPAFPDVGPDRT